MKKEITINFFPMSPLIIKWIVVILALLNFGYMAFDGGRALLKGDYIRPTSGKHAGQLGPWSGLVKKIGINPESNAMKIIFVAWGIIGIILTICFILDISWAHQAMVVINVFSLWYLIPGTISSVLQIILLLML